MPETALRYIVDYLFDAGPSMPSGLGEAPLTHGEIRAWQDNTGIRLSPSEARAVRRASIEYVAFRSRASNPSMPAPWDGHTVSDDEKRAVAKSLRDTLRGMAR